MYPRAWVCVSDLKKHLIALPPSAVQLSAPTTNDIHSYSASLICRQVSLRGAELDRYKVLQVNRPKMKFEA